MSATTKAISSALFLCRPTLLISLFRTVSRTDRLVFWAQAIACWMIISTASRAGEFDYHMEFGLAYSDNFNFAHDANDALIANALIGANYSAVARDYDLQFNGRGGYRYYSDNIGNETLTDHDENIYDAQARAQWHISPNFFSWVLEDYLRQSLINSLANSAPNNNQHSNIIMTGPNWFIRPSSADVITVTARKGLQRFSTEGADNDRVWTTLAWQHHLSAVVSAAGQFEAQNVHYNDSAINPDYERRDGFVQINWQSGINQWRGDYGVTRIERDTQMDIDGKRWGVSWLRMFASDSSLNLNIRQGFSDSALISLASGAEAMANSLPTGGLDVVVGDLIDEHATHLVYRHRRAAGHIQAQLFRIEREFQRDSSFNEKSRGAGLSYEQVLSDLWAMQNFMDYTLVDYTNFSRQDHEIRLVARFNRLIGPHSALAFEFSRRDHDSDETQFKFVENQVQVLFRYQSTSAAAR